MALVTSDFLSALTTTVRGDFHREYDAAMGVQAWRQLAMVVPATTETISQQWLGAVPGMQDVTHSDLKTKDMALFDLTKTDKTWKNGFEVSRRAIEDDSLGWVPLRVAQLAEEAAAHPGRRLFQQVRDGNTSAVVTFDGSNLFADAHSIGGQTIDNNLASAGSVAVAIQDGIGAMLEFPDEEGRPMGLSPNVIMVPAELVAETYAALNATQGYLAATTAGGGMGPVIPPASANGTWNAAGYTVIANAHLTDAAAIFMFHVTGSRKPFIFQERIKPTLEAMDDPQSETGVIRDKFIYSGRARNEIYPSDPRYSIRVDLA